MPETARHLHLLPAHVTYPGCSVLFFRTLGLFRLCFLFRKLGLAETVGHRACHRLDRRKESLHFPESEGHQWLNGSKLKHCVCPWHKSGNQQRFNAGNVSMQVYSCTLLQCINRPTLIPSHKSVDPKSGVNQSQPNITTETF